MRIIRQKMSGPDNTKKKSGFTRARLRRDLIICAAVIVLIFAYYIPGVIFGVQDVNLAGRKMSFEAETVHFTSENSLLMERLRMFMTDFQYDYNLIMMDSGNQYTAKEAENAIFEEIRKLSDAGIDPLGDVLKTTSEMDLKDHYIDAEMGVGSQSHEPFIIWVGEFTFQNDMELTAVLDEGSGKLLCLAASDWREETSEWSDWFCTNDAKVGEVIASYYDLETEAVESYMQEPYLGVLRLRSGSGETVAIPLIAKNEAWDSRFGINSPDSPDFLSSYGIDLGVLDPEQFDGGAEAEMPPEENAAKKN